MKTKNENKNEIEIRKIKILDNARIRIEEKELSSLMEDIKHRGLLQPVGVLLDDGNYILRYGQRRLEACKKLGWETIPCYIKEGKIGTFDFLSDNVAENMEREDLTPIEFAAICKRFLEAGYNITEIAAKLSESRGKIETALKLASSIPKEFRDEVKYQHPRVTKAMGSISVSTANGISRLRISKDDKLKLYKETKQKELSLNDIRIIGDLLRGGMSFEKAMEKKELYVNKTMHCAVDKKELKKYKMPFIKLIKKIVSGKLPPNKKLLR